MDPILHERPAGDYLLAYFVQEHWDPCYRAGLTSPARPYDLFLDHMLAARTQVIKLPQSISFPYLRAPEILAGFAAASRDEVAWVDWRTITAVTGHKTWDDAAEATVGRLSELFPVKLACEGGFSKGPYGISDPPSWGDAQRYLARLGRCKYYISVGRESGGGQGVCDAASLGCLCIGSAHRPYHRLVCHPRCLVTDLEDLYDVLKDVSSSADLRAEARAYQDASLRQHFRTFPLALIDQARGLRGYRCP
jgi:hypothetical protein